MSAFDGIEETGKFDTKQYQRDYYKKRKKEIAARKAARYREDTKFREVTRDRALGRYRKERAEIEKERRKIGWRPKTRGYNKPRLMQINGADVFLHSPAAFADAAGVSVQTIGLWEERGILPPPTIKDELGRRWYSAEYLKEVSAIVRQYKSEGGLRLAILKERIAKALRESDVKWKSP